MATTTTIQPAARTGAGIANTIQEQLPPGVQEVLQEIEPVFKTIIQTSQNVSESIGLGWQVEKMFNLSLSGAINWTTVQESGTVQIGGSLTTGPTVDNRMASTLRYAPGSFTAYPTADKASGVGTLIRKLSMSRGQGNFFLPLDAVKASELSAARAQFVTREIMACAKRVAFQKAISLFDSGGYTSLGTISAIDGTYDGSNGKMIVTITAGTGRMSLFQPGMFILVADDDGASAPDASDLQNSSMPLVVDTVDRFNRKVTLVDPAGGNASALGIATGDYLLPWGATDGSSWFTGPYGFSDWMKSTDDEAANTYLFDSSSQIDMFHYREFASYLVTVSAALTEQKLNLYTATFQDACDVDLDTIITTRLVTMKYLEQPHSGAGRQSFDRQGAALRYQGGYGQIGYTMDGQDFMWHSSRYMPSGTMYIVKLKGGNLKMYVPPRLPKAGSQRSFSQEIEFVAPALGYRDIFAPVTWDTESGTAHSTGVIRLVQAPFDMLYQLAPDEVRGIKLSSITEAS